MRIEFQLTGQNVTELRHAANAQLEAFDTEGTWQITAFDVEPIGWRPGALVTLWLAEVRAFDGEEDPDDDWWITPEDDTPEAALLRAIQPRGEG